MKESPILMQSWKVRRILEWDWSSGNMQTRRVIDDILPTVKTIESNGPGSWAMRGNWNGWTIKCRYGVPGDLIWVKETFCYASSNGYDRRDDGGEFWYKATDEHLCAGPWKPSLFMPKLAARIWLEVVDVKVERLHDIDNHQSWKEGIPEFGRWLKNEGEAKDEFSRIWNNINAKNGYGWDVNPWVWVVTYKLHDKKSPS